MRKFFIAVVFVALGSGLWWLLSNTARFSLKKWDAKFDTVLRHSLTESGLKDQDVLSNVNQILKDSNGEWVVKKIHVKKMDVPKIEELKNNLESSGAQVEESFDHGQKCLLVRRGRRLYQEIRFN